MKKAKLCLFFLGDDEAQDFLETEQTCKEDGTAIDGKSDDESQHPVEIQLFYKEGDQGDGGQENDDMEPITTLDFQLQDALGEEVLQEGGDSLHTEAGAGGAHRIEARDDDEVEQDVDGHAGASHYVELFQAAVGGEQCAEDVGRRQAEETTHQ